MAEDRPPNLAARTLRLLRPSHQHSAYSATVLLMGAVMVSRVIGYVREAYIACVSRAFTLVPDPYQVEE